MRQQHLQNILIRFLKLAEHIASVAKADSNNLNISLKTGSDISSVICTLTVFGDISDLKEGDEITLRGECSGFLMDVLLNNCAIIPGKK